MLPVSLTQKVSLFQPAALFYLWRQPTLLNALLNPINHYMANDTFCSTCGWPKNQTWQHRYSIHYLGQYPIAELQCWGNGYRKYGNHGSGK